MIDVRNPKDVRDVRRAAIDVTDALDNRPLHLDVETIREVQPMFTIGGSIVMFVDCSVLIVAEPYHEVKAKITFAH